jgi:hypothetical protein
VVITTTSATAFTPTTGLPGGPYSWLIIAHDRAGNQTASSQAFTFTLDTSAAIYLPVVTRNFQAIPDLRPTRLIIEPSTGLGATTPVVLGVVIENQGNGPAPANFWVDFYINPPSLPTTAGHLWSSGGYCGTPCYGLAWQVTAPLAPGQVITLTSTGPYLMPTYTRWPGYFNSSGTQRVGVYVDSWNGTDPAGFVKESNETNNSLGLTSVGVSSAGAEIDTSAAEYPREGDIPARPLPPQGHR